MAEVVAAEAGGITLNECLQGGILFQVALGGITSFIAVRNGFGAAQRLCTTNKALQTEQTVLRQAMAEAENQQQMADRLGYVINSWSETWNTLEAAAAHQRKQFLLNYTVYLVFLSLITVMLFFAVEKKGGRLDRLFHKIGRIKASLHEEAA